MKIGEVAKAAGIGIDAIRFYEREGLVEKPARRPSGYRVYEPDVVHRLRFIRRAKTLGFSLKEIAELLSLDADPHATAADVQRLAEKRLADIDDKIRSLQRMRGALRQLAAGCPGRGPTRSCSILRSLTAPARGQASSRTPRNASGASEITASVGEHGIEKGVRSR